MLVFLLSPTKESLVLHAGAKTEPLRRRGVLSAFGSVALVMGLVLGSFSTASASPAMDTINAINQRYADFGGASSVLGTPTGEIVDVAGGARRDYSGGAIFYTAQTGARVMFGEILKKYLSLGGPDSGIGFPLNDETRVADLVGQYNDFSAPGGAAIYWSPNTGAYLIKGKVLEAWRASGATNSPFGYPNADATTVNGTTVSQFIGPGGTEIRWSEATGLSTVPAGLAASIPGFQAGTQSVEGSAAVPTPSLSASPPATSGTSVGGVKWWPVVGLVIAALLAVLRGLLARRRRSAKVVVPATRAPEPGVAAPVRPRLVESDVKAPPPPPARPVPPPPPAPPTPPPPPEVRKTPPPAPEVRKPAPTAPVRDPAPAPEVHRVAERPTQEERTGDPISHLGRPTPIHVEAANPAAAPMVVNFADAGTDVGAITVTYDNNAIGVNQQSHTDKSGGASRL
jgi:hypothetical protein